MSENIKTVLVTGTAGMIGSHIAERLLSEGCRVIGLDRAEHKISDDNYMHITAELSELDVLNGIFEKYTVDRVIHLAAIAHAFSNGKITYEQYYAANVAGARNIFLVAAQKKVPVLFISTADVYGFTKGVADKNTAVQPVSDYAKSKVLAEQELISICSHFGCEYDIFRLAPVYTDEIKRDIQKRYYLRYPDWAYIIGNGTEYEFLNINTLCEEMAEWTKKLPESSIHNIKDKKLVNTAECLEAERKEGRAKHILHFPQWLVRAGIFVVTKITGKNRYTFLLNKAVNPIRTK